MVICRVPSALDDPGSRVVRATRDDDDDDDDDGTDTAAFFGDSYNVDIIGKAYKLIQGIFLSSRTL